MASTLDNYFSAVEPIRSLLPVVDKEIGDTWIQGDASDPRKCAEVRAIGRALGSCFHWGDCSPDDPRVWNSTRIFAKTFEHTWGLSEEVDLVHWDNEEFHQRRAAKVFVNCENSWIEQRHVYQYAIEALQDHPVVADIKTELDKLKPSTPDLTDYHIVDKTAKFSCPGNMDMQFGQDGSVTRLTTNGTDWASVESSLGKFIYQTYDANDFTVFNREYSYDQSRNVGIHKTNITLYAHPESKIWPVSFRDLYQHTSGDCNFLVHLTMADKQTWSYYGAPQNIWIQYQARLGNPTPDLDITFQFFNKTVTRLPESLSLFFHPLPIKEASWKLSKLGGLVDPLNVILNGSQHQHAMDDNGMFYGDAKRRIQIASPDVPVVIMSTKSDPFHSAFPTPLQPLSRDLLGGGFNIYNNIWDTNWIFWYPYLKEDEAFKARFVVNLIDGKQ